MCYSRARTDYTMNSNGKNTYKRKRSESSSSKNKRYQKKRYNKSRESNGALFAKQNQLVIADKQFIKLKYVDVTTPVLSIPLAGAVSSPNIYALNGLFDVNGSIASTAIAGFTEWGQFYTKYRVKACKIDCDLLTETASANIGFLFHVQPAAAAPPTFTSWQAIREFQGNPYTTSGVLGITEGQSRARISKYVDCSKLQGGKEYDIDENYVGTF